VFDDGFEAHVLSLEGFEAHSIPCDGFEAHFIACDGFEAPSYSFEGLKAQYIFIPSSLEGLKALCRFIGLLSCQVWVRGPFSSFFDSFSSFRV
jgi:hypothetical protein